MRKIILISAAILIASNLAFSQGTAINTTGANADASAMLDVSSTEKGQLIPRMTTAQRNSILSPAEALLIYNTTSRCFEAYNSGILQWVSFGCISCQLPGTFITTSATSISQTSFTANWTASLGATTYYLDISTGASFSDFVPGYNNLDAGNVQTLVITSLQCNTTYYYRVRAANSCGASANSTIQSAVTSACVPTAPPCGGQIFMLANINAGTFINSTSGGSQQTNDGMVEKYCYNNVAANCNTYGGLYEWAEAVQVSYIYNTSTYGTQTWMTCDPCESNGRQSLCPDGFHIPTDLEWSRYEYCTENTISPTGSTPLSTFQNVFGTWRGGTGSEGPGAKLKATAGDSPPFDGNNLSGFTALPHQYRVYADGSFDSGTTAHIWTSTEGGSNLAWYHYLWAGNNQSGKNNNYKTYGFSLRCLKN